MFDHSDKTNLKRSVKYVALLIHSVYSIRKNKKKSSKNKEFYKKISSKVEWKLRLPDGSYSVSDIQDQFDYFIRNNDAGTNDPQIRIYSNEIENRTTFKIKAGYYLELLSPKTMELIGSTKSKTTQDENGENNVYFE